MRDLCVSSVRDRILAEVLSSKVLAHDKDDALHHELQVLDKNHNHVS